MVDIDGRGCVAGYLSVDISLLSPYGKLFGRNRSLPEAGEVDDGWATAFV